MKSSTALISGLALAAAVLLVSLIWPWARYGWREPVLFESRSGESLNVTARDQANRPIAKFTVPGDPVWLPAQNIRLDITAPYRLNCSQTINVGNPGNSSGERGYYLDALPSHQWMLDKTYWHQVIDLERNGESQRYCLALTGDGIILLELTTGNVLWKFKDSSNTAWGDADRGCPSSFQPDRFVVVPDSNGNQCQEIVLAHPKLPELLCLDAANGERLWQTDIIQTAGIKAANAKSLCPIALHCSGNREAEPMQVNAIVAPHLDFASALQDRWLINVDAATGKARWGRLSNQSITASGTSSKTPGAAGPVPNFIRPLHLQWGKVKDRPRYFSAMDSFHYRDDYWRIVKQADLMSVLDQDVQLGTDRPFSLASPEGERLHWIDGSDWQSFDPKSGELIKASKLPGDSVTEPRMLRIANGRNLLLTTHSRMLTTEVIAWDVDTQQTVWKQMIACQLDRFSQSYLSRRADFPMIVDLNGDGIDELIAPSTDGFSRWSYSMTPPYGMLMLHRGDTGSTMWDEPFHLPNMDGLIDRGVVVPDADSDGWKDLLLGSRCWGGGVRDSVACFVDLISGKTGQRIWHAQVRTETDRFTREPTELVELTSIEHRQLVAVVTHAGAGWDYNISSPRPYSTTFLNLFTGQEEAFALGVKASEYERDIWIEQRLPSANQSSWQTEAQPCKILGWNYPNQKSASVNNQTLWTARVFQIPAYGDLDKDDYPEVLAHTNSDMGVEYSLLDGKTGLPRWKKRMELADLTDSWYALEYDVNRDNVNDLAVLLTPHVDAPSPVETRIEIVSGANGKAIGKQSTKQSGAFSCVEFFPGDAEKKPLLIVQSFQDKSIVCFDLGLQSIAWTSDQFKVDVTPGTLPSTIAPSFTTSHSKPKRVWFSIAQTSEAHTANFVDAGTGEFLLQFPIDQGTSEDGTIVEKVIHPNWITLDGRELLAIQVFKRRPLNVDSSSYEYLTDLWLVDKTVQQVTHWNEKTSGPDSTAFSSWLANADAATPAIVKTESGQEKLAVQTIVDGSIVFRLLKFDETDKSQLTVDQTVDMAIPSTSATAFAFTLDCNDDGITDYLKFSEKGVECISGSGESLWHRPVKLSENIYCETMQHNDRRYVLVQSLPVVNAYYFDAQTGDEHPEFANELVNDIAQNSQNSADKQHASWLKCHFTPSGCELTVIQRGEPKPQREAKHERDPRYLRLLPWVVHANQFLDGIDNQARSFTWLRLLKLTLGVFIIPAFVLWHCLRKRISLRQLLLLATVIAIAMSLVIKDKTDYPRVESYNGYAIALLTCFSLAVQAFFMGLPLWQMAKGGWRRRLSLGLYAALLLIIPIFTLLSNPAGVIPTTYISHRWWYLFGLALFPTGMILFVILGIALLYRGMRKRKPDRKLDDKRTLVT